MQHEEVEQASAGGTHTLVLTKSGKVYAYGRGRSDTACASCCREEALLQPIWGDRGSLAPAQACLTGLQVNTVGWALAIARATTRPR
jgi:alpha-tubulin suppressor-like RCC1 family protein